MVTHQTANQMRFLQWPAFTDLIATILTIVKRLPLLDTPMVYVLGLVGFVGIRRHATLMRLLLLAQLALVGVIALEDPLAVWPRRFLMVPFFCVALVVAAWQDQPRWRRAILYLFLAGNGWQLTNTVLFVRQPFDYHVQGYGHTLPYVWSTVDYMVPYGLIDAYEEMAQQVDQGQHLVLVYNIDAYDENVTNPTGILHRLYLHVGDAVWQQRVHVYGATQCSHDCCVPIKPMNLVSELARLDPKSTVAYAILSDNDTPNFRAEAAAVMDVLESNFHVDSQEFRTGHGARVQRLMLTRKS